MVLLPPRRALKSSFFRESDDDDDDDDDDASPASSDTGVTTGLGRLAPKGAVWPRTVPWRVRARCSCSSRYGIQNCCGRVLSSVDHMSRNISWSIGRNTGGPARCGEGSASSALRARCSRFCRCWTTELSSEKPPTTCRPVVPATVLGRAIDPVELPLAETVDFDVCSCNAKSWLDFPICSSSSRSFMR